jgi:hypothetical protein
MEKTFKIRCSGIGEIMTNARSKTEVLGKTSKDYCELWVKEQLYGRKKFFSNKYTEKGIIVEQDALDYVAEVLDYGMLVKNEQYFENDFLTGTPDAILNDHIIDVKSSWSFDTFPLFEKNINKSYFYQAQGYMELTGKDKYKLIYCLMNTPEHLIEKEAHSRAYAMGYQFDDVIEKVKNDLTFDGLDSKLRLKVYEIERDQETIDAIKERVSECRKYIGGLWK